MLNLTIKKVLHLAVGINSDSLGCALVTDFCHDEYVYDTIFINRGGNTLVEIIKDKLDKSNEYEKVLITGVPATDYIAKNLEELGVEIRLITHHKSTYGLKGNYPWITVETEHDGTASSSSGILFRENYNKLMMYGGTPIIIETMNFLKPIVNMIECYVTGELKKPDSVYYSGVEEYFEILIKCMGIESAHDIMKKYISGYCELNLLNNEEINKGMSVQVVNKEEKDTPISDLLPDFALTAIKSYIKSRDSEISISINPIHIEMELSGKPYNCTVYLNDHRYTKYAMEKVSNENQDSDIIIAIDPILKVAYFTTKKSSINLPEIIESEFNRPSLRNNFSSVPLSFYKCNELVSKYYECAKLITRKK